MRAKLTYLLPTYVLQRHRLGAHLLARECRCDRAHDPECWILPVDAPEYPCGDDRGERQHGSELAQQIFRDARVHRHPVEETLNEQVVTRVQDRSGPHAPRTEA